MWITIDQIECLNEIENQGSITKAADTLGRAKSALNYSITNLEEQLGFTLLDKSKYRAVLTPKAKLFVESSKSLLNEFESLKNTAIQLSNNVETKIKISGSGVCSLEKLYRSIKLAMDKYPATQIELEREILSGQQMLAEGIVDIALLEGLTNKEDFEYIEVDSIHFKLVISSDHPFLKLKKSEQTIQNLYNYPQIVQRSTIPSKSSSRGIHTEAVKWNVTDTLSKKEIILNGLGWGRLPDHDIKEELKSKQLVHLKALKIDDKVPVYLARRKQNSHGKVSELIWKSILT
jgi:DNA-binding transcriptional LysR family regulator